jgi:hypothetical protein
VSWRDLKLKAEFLHQRLNQDGDESSNELAELMETTQDARTTLLYRSLSVFFGLASCMPGTLWEVSLIDSPRDLQFFFFSFVLWLTTQSSHPLD